MTNPYEGLPDRAFWRTAVAGREPGAFEDIYRPRFPITRQDRIFTAGSCFAQHVGRTLREAGFDVIDMEQAPEMVADDVARQFGFRMYSARYGNIYTARQLLQLTREALGKWRSKPADGVWSREGRFFDALRPAVEPEGLASVDEVHAHRARHLKAVAKALSGADLIVFTFGLTEAWAHAKGTIYPTAPGVIADAPDRDAVSFKNFTFGETLDDFIAFRALAKPLNPNVRFLITVSPVPLTATASQDHVMVATMRSKSTLKAVAAELTDRFEDIDYFPSYELIASPPARGAFFAPNMRSVSDEGVRTAMSFFLSAIGAEGDTLPVGAKPFPLDGDNGEGVQCEEVLLDAFAGRND